MVVPIAGIDGLDHALFVLRSSDSRSNAILVDAASATGSCSAHPQPSWPRRIRAILVSKCDGGDLGLVVCASNAAEPRSRTWAPWILAYRSSTAQRRRGDRLRRQRSLCSPIPPAVLTPLECCFGTMPIQAQKFRPERKALGSATLATKAVASAGPMPGSASSRLLVPSMVPIHGHRSNSRSVASAHAIGRQGGETRPCNLRHAVVAYIGDDFEENLHP